jgi:hypothetical protein
LAAAASPFKRCLVDERGGVTLTPSSDTVYDKCRIPVVALADENVPVVESRGIAGQVPLSDDFGAVARGPQQLREGLLRAVELLVVRDESVPMAVLSREHDGA